MNCLSFSLAGALKFPGSRKYPLYKRIKKNKKQKQKNTFPAIFIYMIKEKINLKVKN